LKVNIFSYNKSIDFNKNLKLFALLQIFFADIILKDFDLDIYNYKMKHIEHSDQQDENNLSSKQDNSVLLNQVKSLKQQVNTLQFEQDQLERKYKEKLEEDNEVNQFVLLNLIKSLTNLLLIYCL